MQRLVVLVIIVLLGIAPIGNIGRSASAQGTPTPTEKIETCEPKGNLLPENEELRWYGVCEPIPEDVTISVPILQTMQPYAVVFKDVFAATEFIPDDNAEYMVVHVKEGNFALDLDDGSPQVVVSTPQDHIHTLTPRFDEQPYFDMTGGFLTVDGTVDGERCTRACPVDPGVPVLLMPGDVAIAEKGALCIYCLLNGNKGLLEVFVLLNDGATPQDFSWISDWNAPEEDPAAAASASTEPTVMAWAFLNPSGRCDH